MELKIFKNDFHNIIFHRVCSGETLDDILKLYNVSERDVTSACKNLTDGIFCGAVLIIKKTENKKNEDEKQQLYIVKPFDTPKKIAEKFGIREDELLYKNNSQCFFLGQKIIIPKNHKN